MKVCSFCDLRCREVVSVGDGKKLGYVSDIEFDLCSGKILSIVVPAEKSLLSLGAIFQRDEYRIPWDCIQRIGDDIILVSNAEVCSCKKK